MTDENRKRREILEAGLTAAGVGLAGCSSLLEGDSTDSSTSIESAPESPVETVDTAETSTFTEKGTGKVSDSPTSDQNTETPPVASETATPTATFTQTVEPKPLTELRFEDPDKVLHDYGNERYIPEEAEDVGPYGSLHTIEMGEEERRELYEEDLFKLISEDEYQQMLEYHEDNGSEKFMHYIWRASPFDRTTLDKRNFSPKERQLIKYDIAKNAIRDSHKTDLNDARIGLIPEIRWNEEEHNEVVAEIVNLEEDIHKIWYVDPEEPSFRIREPGELGTLDGSKDIFSAHWGASEFEVMREQINTGWQKSMDSINPDKLQGMFRDRLVGFTNWNSNQESVGFEQREEAEQINTHTPTDTPKPDNTAKPTPTPSEAELPDIQVAAHQPFAEDYRQATLEGEEEKIKQRIDLSDALTDYIIDEDHEEVYGIAIGGTVEDPAILEVGYDEREFFNAIHDLEADPEVTIDELKEQYRESGEIPRVEVGVDKSYATLLGAAAAGGTIGSALKYLTDEDTFEEGILDAEDGIIGSRLN